MALVVQEEPFICFVSEDAGFKSAVDFDDFHANELVWGHVSLPWEFHDHFSFFAEIYTLKLAESKKLCHQFFQRWWRHFLCKWVMTSWISHFMAIKEA